jgi:hypothetical protein
MAHPRRKDRGLAALLSVLALAACGGAEEEPEPPSAGAPIPSGGLSVSEAKASDLEGPLRVRGYVIEGRLCEAILESDPPQCGEPSLRLEGDLSQLEDAGPNDQVSVLGDVEGDVITLSATSR